MALAAVAQFTRSAVPIEVQRAAASHERKLSPCRGSCPVSRRVSVASEKGPDPLRARLPGSSFSRALQRVNRA